MTIKSPLKQSRKHNIISDKINLSKALTDALLFSKTCSDSDIDTIWAVDDHIYLTLGKCTIINNLHIYNFENNFESIKNICSNKEMMVLCSSLYAQDILPLISYLTSNNIKFIPVGGHGVGGYVYDDRVTKETIENAYLTQSVDEYGKFDDPGTISDFVNITQALNYTKHLNGSIVEVGCYRGSSGCIMLDYVNNKGICNKDFYFFDVFDGFNYIEAINSSDWIWAGTHQTEGIEIISKRLKDKSGGNNVIVKKMNIINDTIPSDIKAISLLNIDVDLYEAVGAALFRLAEYVVAGGIIICEDAGHTPGLIGARLALEEFINSPVGRQFTPVHMESGQVFLIRHTA